MPRWPLPPLDPNDGGRGSGSGVAETAAAADLARERLRASLDYTASRALALGVPRSALPAPQAGASAEELAAAVGHVEDMVASFLSANI